MKSGRRACFKPAQGHADSLSGNRRTAHKPVLCGLTSQTLAGRSATGTRRPLALHAEVLVAELGNDSTPIHGARPRQVLLALPAAHARRPSASAAAASSRLLLLAPGGGGGGAGLALAVLSISAARGGCPFLVLLFLFLRGLGLGLESGLLFSEFLGGEGGLALAPLLLGRLEGQRLAPSVLCIVDEGARHVSKLLLHAHLKAASFLLRQ
mmetsp:Transcript_111009/g.353725  ORF Transcript_111009/g.353725 Transcript_111009/m.353725 type:complete len:210 (+) Transcript_111009:50-679(+)